ncbi:hypothetical protein AAVH_26999 [Aphelenchoides avenae]|nr:hypothetical protein AAVH_26999 [Aphelenchus avenae]
MQAAALNTLIQICFTSILHGLSLGIFVSILTLLWRRRSPLSDVSVALKLFVSYWALITAMATVHNVYCLAYWRPDDNAYNQYLLFWTAIFDRSAYAGISVAVFFITLDSCLTLRLRLRYSDRIKMALRVLLIVSSFFVSVTTLVTYALQPYRNDPECRSCCCTKHGTNAFFYYSRVLFGVFNILGTAWFVSLLRKFNRQRTGVWTDPSEKRSSLGNSVVKYTVALELITLAMYIMMIVVDKFIDLTAIYQRVGPIQRILGALEASCCAVMYRML